MRAAFVETLTRLAHDDDRVVLLTGDLGFMALEPFADAHPGRFVNVGVAEQDMIGIATGLAESGFRPYCYSIAPFAALRPYEQIRNGPVAHRLPVTVVGVGAGFEYGSAGFTHHGIDDLGALRAQLGLTLVSPADARQTASALEVLHGLPGPAYLRIGKDDRTVVPGLDGRFALGRVETVRDGEVPILALGAMGTVACGTAELLATQGIECSVHVVASVSPSPADDLRRLASGRGHLFTVEAHGVIGGLHSLVAESVASMVEHRSVHPLAVEQWTPGHTGSEPAMRARHGLLEQQIADRIIGALRP